MKRGRWVSFAAAAVLAATTGLVALTSQPAEAHGAMMAPGSRTYLCWLDGLDSTGAINPKNPACAAAVAQSGATSLYNWFAVLRSDGGGRTSGFIPDGQPCSGGTGGPYNFTGFNLARTDWPVTHLTSGASMRFDYNNWAKHPGTFSLYITKDSWSPTRPLAWSDLESTPFSQVVNPSSTGGPGTAEGRYSWNAMLPSGKTGRHLIYSVWSRSDSQETFYGCSDVVFDGGNGEVTGVGDSTLPPPGGEDPTEPGEPPSGSCDAAYAVTSSWGGGFQGQITVRAGDSALNGWMVHWTWPGTQTVTQAWNGRQTSAGSLVTITNETWNGSLAARGTATIGFLANGTAPAALNELMCMPA
ncbi:lytic polysaccharide monooxygenase [Actinoplanes sp. NBRC 103695]|uniref:lytic polysaccharide monooxygenase auxiliary activity family 9 protein n=1 Tax=Actinoplanes sp. NBRC 103695 TaxID=3032202 RepID=UPI0024A388C4|nr:lytic polysaccharide monooxygenase [Actinoplanes sp. NBRC 103695]GLZ00165.1 chitin-binding protein [Actinoplanes sp. NBRC 103695]